MKKAERVKMALLGHLDLKEIREILVQQDQLVQLDLKGQLVLKVQKVKRV